MKRLSTTSVSLAVTPTALSTFFSHYLRRKPLRQRPTAHLSYDEGLHLIRSFLDFASRHTVEELQAFTSQWVPHPQWVCVEAVTVSDELLQRAADLLIRQLGEDGIRQVGGREWWRWRGPESTSLGAEWIEMRKNVDERERSGDGERRIMLYLHGGAYFFGGVDEHRYQLQRHARKLKARVLAPNYRLAPQFPFPCGLHDCLATYLYLLESQDASTVVFAGDSAGGGLVLSLLCILRDEGLPLPAGAVLVSPWVDLTHSFPSVATDAPLDYIPAAGFHYKPSRAWPPPNADDMVMLRAEAEAARRKRDDNGKTGASVDPVELQAKQNPPVATRDPNEPSAAAEPGGHQSTSGGLHTDTETFLTIETAQGQRIAIRDQIQMYTTNSLLSHPLVSPVMQPTLGGLPPLLILVGGGELLRDEQIYVAHKCANPERYAPDPERLTDRGRELLLKHKPTDVQLQVWDDLCHVPPTLSFTRPAKYMYRSIAQFGAWALARAQKMGIDILDDESISVITSSDSDSDEDDASDDGNEVALDALSQQSGRVGRAGDALPPFRKHMIRQRVTRHGVILPLAPESELPGCCIEAVDVGVIKEGPVAKWLAMKKQWDAKYPAAKAKVHKQMVDDMIVGFDDFGPDEHPPPSALAGRRRRRQAASDPAQRKRTKGVGLALWSLWGSKHDEATVEREERAELKPLPELEPLPDLKNALDDDGYGHVFRGDAASMSPNIDTISQIPSRSRRRTVVDENQTGGAEHTPLESSRQHDSSSEGHPSTDNLLKTGVTGKRPQLGGIAMPFSLNKKAETASMLTLNSSVSPAPSAVGSIMDIAEKQDQEKGVAT
ncbi:AB hydrolase superfamily protein C4A8.06c [Ophiocordyceps camponoti-floridani]|uniref:AB hydrolase superfamily protein C4A8.06c n=1 Tax=Ophiocordyceps camponoti-floridani TaxID=2030778 RepID=A0A8H4QDU3_9HYPO|nr:AB hydrolase superfamily protein C4A8.06c [Ophiocordyceps camponoti-floridani]